MKRLFYALTLVAFVGTSGCLKNIEDRTPFEPDTIVYDSSEIFAGVLSPLGSRSHSFTLDFESTIRITFASLTTGTTALSLPATITLGTPSSGGATCTATSTIAVAPSLTANLTQALVSGTHCVGIADEGSLTGDANFAIRIRKSLTVPSFGQAGTDTFSTNLYPGGRINRTFGASQGGQVTVDLTGVTPQAAVALGIGVSDDSLADCYLNKVVVTTPGSGAQLTADVEPGQYCVKVFDPGGLGDRVTFDVKITHP